MVGEKGLGDCCGADGVDYEALCSEAQQRYHDTQRKQRLFVDIRYAAERWDRERWAIVKAQHSARGGNPRFVATNLEGEAQYLYDKLYCIRGEMENRIKEQRLMGQSVPGTVVGFRLIACWKGSAGLASG